ncbi:MAG: NUDIX domain-containing protein [Candidatus Levybacteria bacterium]|nr:NUDIX domain-containing protein [Candidatus Levybacteria bacterium]
MERKIDPQRKEQLTSFLEKYGIDTKIWGEGATKTVELLMEELDKGEAMLSVTEEGNLLRVLNSLCVNIRHRTSDGKIFILEEERQEFQNGQSRKRVYLNGSVAGKIEKGETPEEAARRELLEELKIPFEGALELEAETVSLRESQSYPGLTTQYNLSIFAMEMPAEYFKSEGYIEVQDRVTTYFGWKQV